MSSHGITFNNSMGEYCADMLQDMAELENLVISLRKEQAATYKILQKCVRSLNGGKV